MNIIKLICATILALHCQMAYSYEKNTPDDPLIVDNEFTVNQTLSLGSHPAIKAPLPPDKQWWNFGYSEKHVYRLIVINYSGYVNNKKSHFPDSIAATKITPGREWLISLSSKEECEYEAKSILASYADANYWDFSNGKRLWKDLDGGVLGFQNSKNVAVFVRAVCLPSKLVDDLDMLGTEYQYGSPLGPCQNKTDEIIFKGKCNDLVLKGQWIFMSSDDPRKNFRYDPARFFERFEPYGVASNFKVPDTKDREGWEKSDWNQTIKTFPLENDVELLK